MKVAVVSDIHGYSLALDKVLADIDREPGITHIVAAGDLCESGPDPGGVLQLLTDRNIPCVRGNTDRDLASGARKSKRANWTRKQLGPKGMSFLESLPFEVRLSPPNARGSRDDLLVVHANPFDEERHLAPWFTEDEAGDMIGQTEARVIAFGHLHISYVRQVGQMTLLNVSAVGNPKDEDPRSRWGLCVWNSETMEWNMELRYVDYPLKETQAQIRASGMPNPKKVIRRLKHASYREMSS